MGENETARKSMLDIKLIREDPEKIKDNLRKRGMDPQLVDQLIDIDEKYLKVQRRTEELRARRNYLTKLISGKELDK